MLPGVRVRGLVLAFGCASEPTDAPTPTSTSGNASLPAAPTITGPEARAPWAQGALLQAQGYDVHALGARADRDTE